MPEKNYTRLIEVALPIREISAESVRDKSLRHGHISTLHLWWARRPLAASRAIVFASQVPDPDDPACPEDFRQAVIRLLKDEVPGILKKYLRKRRWLDDPDPYKPYEGIPDTPRNRLLTFIAKWSPEWLAFEKGKNGKQPPPKEMLDDRSLVKWETSNPENEQGRAILKIARELVLISNGGKPPVLLDPFAGGGAIPLEASRLGFQAIANDYNPVAYLILRATCEFPQKYGKPGEREVEVEEHGKMVKRKIKVKNVLAYDVEYWANRILERAKEKIGHLYPPGKDGNPVVGYLWARTAPCSNPTCKAEIPLLRSLLICNKPNKKVALTMKVEGKKTIFGIAKDREIEVTEGTMQNRGNCKCPVCHQVTPVKDLRRAGLKGEINEKIVGVITESSSGKDYRPVEDNDLISYKSALEYSSNIERPQEKIYENIHGIPGTCIISPALYYGMPRWGDLFNARQLLAMHTFIKTLDETFLAITEHNINTDYTRAISAYLGLFLNRIAMRGSSFGVWHTTGEKIEHPFGRQAIPMVWDYPETNPFNESTGGAKGQIDWIIKVIEHESTTSLSFVTPTILIGDGAKMDVEGDTIDIVVTDPPYFDAIAYADLSDFFYVWLKRSISENFPDAFATPLTPKGEEATALKHRHGGVIQNANNHFTSKLAACFAEAKRVSKPNAITSVMFAHQTTEAWSALINSLLEAGLTVTSTYPIDTELTTALKRNASALAASITVSCRPRKVGSAASFRDVKMEIEQAVADSVRRFFGYGLRGADLIVACYGPAVGVFGKYERVERADGTPVTIPELLDLVRSAAMKAIAGEFEGDELSRLYFVWVSQYGISGQPYDDLVKVSQMSMDSEDASEIARRRGFFVVDGSTCRLAMLKDRMDRPNLGRDESAPLIDQLHHAMHLWQQEKRGELVDYLRDHHLIDHTPFWKLAQALFEVLPRQEPDWKLVSALLSERETLRMQTLKIRKSTQMDLFEN